jgi:tetratricopeptide (TPR) repeat protein
MKTYLFTFLILFYYAIIAVALQPYIGPFVIENASAKKVFTLLGFASTQKSTTARLPGNWPPPTDKSSYCGPPQALLPAFSDTLSSQIILMENLGQLQHTITTRSAQAQQFFNQGLRLIYGFNHYEAHRSFIEAARLDSSCAMAYWGQALAMAPNINSPIDKERSQMGYEAIQKALSLKKKASKAEQAYIEAMAKRFSNQENVEQRLLDSAYAMAMSKLAAKYPNDPEAGTLYADALMNRMPWDYWTKEGEPRPGIEQAITHLERVIKQFPNHPGAHHLYIHVVEASNNPDRGVSSADRLAALMPGAGHLVHMPSHIYLRVGRYTDAIESNLNAIEVDESYLAQSQVIGRYSMAYYPHNIHFAWAGAIMEGNSKLAIAMARKTSSRANRENMAAHSILQTFYILPVCTYVRFGKWNEILTEPYPGKELLHASAMWHYGRGLAYTAKGKLDLATKELSILDSLSKDSVANADYATSQMIAIAIKNVGGEMAARQKNYQEAIKLLKEGVRLEDDLKYDEPRTWPQPLRHTLGAVLLEAGLPQEAETVYLDDLKIHRENGWSLFGLKQSLQKQGKTKEAAETEQRLRKVWTHADITLASSRF